MKLRILLAAGLAIGLVGAGVSIAAPAMAAAVTPVPSVGVERQAVQVRDWERDRRDGRRHHDNGRYHDRKRYHDRHDGWRHSKRDDRYRNNHYGSRYGHRDYGRVRPFISFVAILARTHGFHHFGNPRFYRAGPVWSPHYYVRARDRHNRRVTLRVCAYTGNVLGWRY